MSRVLKLRSKIRYSTLFVWALFILLTFFVGFRWDVGLDWPAYMSLYTNYGYVLFQDTIEIGNLGISSWLYCNGYMDGGYFLWVSGFITMFFLFYSMWKYSVFPVLSVILFCSFGMYFELMNGVSQYMAVSLTVYSWRFLFKRNIVRFFAVVICASLFHTSALLMLPMYFICCMKFNKKLLIYFALMAPLLSILTIPLVGTIMAWFPKYEVYQDSAFSELSGALSLLRLIYPLTLFIAIMMIYNKLMADVMSRVITNLTLISIFITLLFSGVSMMIRIGQYLTISFIFMIPLLYKKMSYTNGKIFMIYSIVYSLIYVYITKLSRPIANLLPFDLNFYLAGIGLIKILLISLVCSLAFMFLMTLRLPNK